MFGKACGSKTGKGVEPHVDKLKKNTLPETIAPQTRM